ncbi:hypothetical protein [Bosea sp. TAF32]|uniref:hypothetical protein n=1 Tax=Bosea sp. TAF32 TaxID=3237482 RepID=UPI003F8FB14F
MQASRGFSSFLVISALAWLGLVMPLTALALTLANLISVSDSMHFVRLGAVLMCSGMWASQFFRVPVWNIPLPRFRKDPLFTPKKTFISGLSALLFAANFVLSIMGI